MSWRFIWWVCRQVTAAWLEHSEATLKKLECSVLRESDKLSTSANIDFWGGPLFGRRNCVLLLFSSAAVYLLPRPTEQVRVERYALWGSFFRTLIWPYCVSQSLSPQSLRPTQAAAQRPVKVWGQYTRLDRMSIYLLHITCTDKFIHFLIQR